MRSSSDFQTGALVMLVATVVFGVYAAVLLYPLLSRDTAPNVVVVPDANAEVPPEYAEFFPAEKQKIRKRLDTVTAMSGPRQVPPSGAIHIHTASAPEVPRTPHHDLHFSAASASSPIPPQAERPRGYRHGIHEKSEVSAVETEHRPPTDSHAQLPPGLPAGSVYAPVTVNLDGSLMTGELRAMEGRLMAHNAARITEARVPRKKNVRSARQRPAGDRVLQSPFSDASFQEITIGLQRLANSLEHLERRTELSLTELSIQTAQKNEATRLQMQEWQRLLDAKLKANEVAQRTVVASRPRRTAADISRHEFSDSAAAQPPGVAVLPNTPEAVKQPPAFPTLDDASLPSLEEMLNEADVVPLPVAQRSTLREPQIRTGASIQQPKTASLADEVPVVLRSEDIPPATDTRSGHPAPSVEFLQDTEEVFPVEVFDPKVRSFEQPSDGKGKTSDDAPKPVHTSQSGLKAIPDEAITASSSRPVAFEHVYRFKMADVEDGRSVVPAEGTCPQCGKVHHGNCSNGIKVQKLIQTAGSVSPESKPTVSQTTPKKVTKKTPKRYIPSLKIPTVKSDKREPGILHRIGSSIRHFGRRTVD